MRDISNNKYILPSFQREYYLPEMEYSYANFLIFMDACKTLLKPEIYEDIIVNDD